MESKIRGATYFHYKVMIDGKEHFATLLKGNSKIEALNKLRKTNCIKAEFSVYNYNYYFIQINDKRVTQ